MSLPDHERKEATIDILLARKRASLSSLGCKKWSNRHAVHKPSIWNESSAINGVLIIALLLELCLCCVWIVSVVEVCIRCEDLLRKKKKILYMKISSAVVFYKTLIKLHPESRVRRLGVCSIKIVYFLTENIKKNCLISEQRNKAYLSDTHISIFLLPNR